MHLQILSKKTNVKKKSTVDRIESQQTLQSLLLTTILGIRIQENEEGQLLGNFFFLDENESTR